MKKLLNRIRVVRIVLSIKTYYQNKYFDVKSSKEFWYNRLLEESKKNREYFERQYRKELREIDRKNDILYDEISKLENEKLELLDIKDKYYKLIAAIKVQEHIKGENPTNIS